MPYRHRRMAMLPTPRKRNWLWMRAGLFNTTPSTTLNSDDLLVHPRNLQGIAINLPGFTIWRLHFKFSVRITITTPQANNGVLCTAFIDSLQQTIANQATFPMDEHLLLHEQLYVTETVAQNGQGSGAAAVVPLYGSWDIRSHRKIDQLQDSLIFQCAVTGAATILDYSWTYSALVKLP